MDTGTRTGIVYLADDGSDPVTAYRTSIRNTVAWAEAQGVLYAQGLLSARPDGGEGGAAVPRHRRLRRGHLLRRRLDVAVHRHILRGRRRRRGRLAAHPRRRGVAGGGR
jgi:hypothetical protein